ncbi:mechanosensitive ion channel family protein [Isoptericola sp. NEAU-Y5]|uniref:Mechanosensitive ion channel family protein n=1 Tax=Isoptericola luteus TaxID=2879484 RepID=A0ABS7ZG97_9MICO|nr:mechanosensitive ion channel domain-containing protein [Isoptericola sp. NEAU-Y5]MCA5893331.1 mechanosensitive ion channel family protein [Isoptericola sp. NEAU-Y5]
MIVLPAAPSPEPSSEPSQSPTVGDVVDDAKEVAFDFWEWFTGWPLRVLLIVVIGAVVLVLLRRAIAHVTERIATGAGTPTTEGREAEEPSWRAYFRRSPLVEGAMAAAVNPMARERRAQRARTVGSVLRSTSNIVVGTMIGLMVLQEMGANVGPLLASAGVAGIALGFGAQSLVKDFISGIFLLVEDQFGVGDVVDLGSGAVGTVEEVQLRVTQVRALDGTLWYVRNGEILRAGNMSQQWSRALAEIRVPVDADVDVVRAALGRAADRVQADPELAPKLLETPSVRGVDSVDDFSLLFTMLAQVRPGEQWEVSRELRRIAQAELRAVGVMRPAGERESHDA